ncbi:MAG: hypothetical protein M1154_13240 [Gammaproteobacteria bacterium]|nr:hypothetical protein [Gammaproteobacteria bacterium]
MLSIPNVVVQRGWRCCLWLIAFALPLVWGSLPDSIASTLFIPAWLIVAQFIFSGLVERAYLRRRAWLGQYLEVTSSWHRRLRAGLLAIAWSQVLGIVLAPLLLVSLRRLSDTDWLILLLALGAFILCHHWLTGRLKGHVIADYLPAITRQLTVLPVACLLTFMLTLVALWRPQPYLVNIPWERAIREHLPAMSEQSMLGAFERIAASFELSGFWLMQNALDSLAVSSYVAVLGWVALLLMQGTLAWSFIRLLTGVAVFRGRLLTDPRHKKVLLRPKQSPEN